MATATHPQSDLPFINDDYALDPKDWIPALILQAELEKELAEKRNHLLRRLSTWYSLIAIFRRHSLPLSFLGSSLAPTPLNLKKAKKGLLLVNFPIYRAARLRFSTERLF